MHDSIIVAFSGSRRMSQLADPVIALLRNLVAIDSVNPTLVPGARGEAEIAGRLADELRALGLTVEMTDVTPGRPNVVAVLEGRRSGRSLMLCGHTDTVGEPAVNIALGIKRGMVVRDLLVRAGVDSSLIEVTSHGESALLVPTADGTPEPRNRRVEISVR